MDRTRGNAVWSPGVLHSNDACYLGFESHQGDADDKGLLFAGYIDEVLIFGRPLSGRPLSDFGNWRTRNPKALNAIGGRLNAWPRC